MDDGDLSPGDLAAVLDRLGRAAFRDRAARLAAGVGGIDPKAADAALAAVAARAARPDADDSPVAFEAFREACERPRAAAVFTAHPTFSLSPEAAGALVRAACDADAAEPEPPPLRPSPPTLEMEFERAAAAIAAGRDALDRLAAAFLAEARATWPKRWTGLSPRPVLLASWVGYDTDGRTDIGWQDTLRLRLRMKELQLARFSAQMAALPAPCAEPLRDRADAALEAVRAQIAACPPSGDPEPGAVRDFARALVGARDAAMATPAPLLDLFPAALAAAPDDETRLALCVARAGLAAHGLSLAHTHTRLNASQIHNAARLRFPELAGSPDAPARRRALFAAVDEALASARPEPVDLGGLMDEQASAMRLVMTVAQIAKHVDASQPVRFLVAETESGYTLLAALLLARLCGVEDRVEISPLFETAEALERRGERVVEEALRSPHWRAHLRKVGRMCLQFGYSDSGRYIGQVPASHLIERLKLRVADLLAQHGLADLEVVLFETHGEGLGRGGHPDGLAARFPYLDPPAARAAFARHGIRTRLETSFQGGDGYLIFGAPPWPTPRSRASPSTPSRRRAAGRPTPSTPTRAASRRTCSRARGPRWARWWRTRATARCSAPSARRCWTAPAPAPPRGSRTGAGRRDPPPARDARHPQQRRPPAARLPGERDARAGRGRSREPDTLAELLRASPRFAGAMAFARAALSLSDATCCAATWPASTPACGWTAPRARAAPAAPPSWRPWRGRWTAWASATRRAPSSAPARRPRGAAGGLARRRAAHVRPPLRRPRRRAVPDPPRVAARRRGAGLLAAPRRHARSAAAAAAAAGRGGRDGAAGPGLPVRPAAGRGLDFAEPPAPRHAATGASRRNWSRRSAAVRRHPRGQRRRLARVRRVRVRALADALRASRGA
jgi:phosphoenolpyruvate carboxylase